MSISLTRNTLARSALRLTATKRASHASASLIQSRGKATLPDLPCTLDPQSPLKSPSLIPIR